MAWASGVGRVSGASLNPAVTVGLVVARHLSVLRGGLYMVADTRINTAPARDGAVLCS